MRQLDYLKMNTALWNDIGTEHNYNLSGWVDAAVNLENTLQNLDSELEEFGGIGFASQDEHTDKIIEILTVLRDCRQWLDKDIEDYVDKPLKDIFNALDDQLAMYFSIG